MAKKLSPRQELVKAKMQLARDVRADRDIIASTKVVFDALIDRVGTTSVTTCTTRI